MSSYTLHLLNLVLVYSIAVVGLYLVVGLCGQFSLAQGAFFGIGAYGTALLETRAHWHAIPAAIGGAIIAAAIGTLVGIPVLRLRGHYAAMATIGFGEIVYLTLQNWTVVTGGPDGLKLAHPTGERVFLAITFVLAIAAGFAALTIRRSAFGRQLIAVRDNELAAATSGIAVTQVKVAAFATSALFAGLAGGLYGMLETYVSPDTFTYDFSITLLTMLLVGGRYSVVGAMAGAVLLGFLPEWLRFLKDYYMLLFGALVIASVTFMPSGIAGLFAGRRNERP